jgi:hypothetical protein
MLRLAVKLLVLVLVSVLEVPQRLMVVVVLVLEVPQRHMAGLHTAAMQLEVMVMVVLAAMVMVARAAMLKLQLQRLGARAVLAVLAVLEATHPMVA